MIACLSDRQQKAVDHIVATSDYRADAPGWFVLNWEIYEAFERLAHQARAHGRTRISAKFLFEMIRWNTMLSENGVYKLDNCYSSDCARLYHFLNPGATGLFELRARRAVV